MALKYDQHDPNETKRDPKGCQPMQTLLQNHALEPSILFVYIIFSFFLMVKIGHGALVGLTYVKGTSVDTFF